VTENAGRESVSAGSRGFSGDAAGAAVMRLSLCSHLFLKQALEGIFVMRGRRRCSRACEEF